MVSSLLWLLMVSKSSCHLCLLSPPQRGSISGLNKPGSNDCMLLKYPCGGRPAGKHSEILRVGQNFTVIFQKNLNHYTAASPGGFSIYLGDEQGGMFKTLAQINDMNEPDLHLYTVDVTIPSFKLKKQLFLQTVYVTNNPKAPAAFYQCSDVMIFN